MQRITLKIRGVVAVAMIALLFLMVTTGFILWLAGQGLLNSELAWNIAFRIHPVGGWIILLFGLVHLGLNTKLLANDLKAWREKPPKS